MAKKFGIFNQPASAATGSIQDPWDFDPSSADQRAAPSAGAGTYYGTGYKNKVGRLRGDTVGYRPVSEKQLGTPPKSVV